MNPTSQVLLLSPAFDWLRTRRLFSIAALFLAMISITGCANKRDVDEGGRPKRYDKPVRDPVENRIFYSGWMHPN
jgi:hypothetical protein